MAETFKFEILSPGREVLSTEATEVVMAAKDVEADIANSDGENIDKSKLIYEVTDLWFHTLVLLTHQNLHPDDVLNELSRRMGTSGIVEKASRK